MLIDTHAHIYADEFNADVHELIQQAILAGVTKIMVPNIDVQSIFPLKNICQQYPTVLYPMMGLHPCYVKEDVHSAIALIKQELYTNQAYYVGVGETGIDLYWDKSTYDLQKQSFIEHIKWAKELDKPLIIHARNSIQEIFDILDVYMDHSLQGIFHCFTGSVKEAEKIISYKTFKMGIGGVLTYKNSTLPEVIKHIDLKYLVLETDAPYLPPVPYRGKRNECSYMPKVAEKLAEVLQIPISMVETQTTSNALNVFNIQT